MKTKDDINKAFDDIVLTYDFNIGRIKDKYNHSYRVANICEYLAEKIGEDSNLAYVIGLLHDIGKFEQISLYINNGYSKGIDHGKLGKKIIEENISNFLDDYSNSEILLSSVEEHNKYIPDIFALKHNNYISLLRDSDKLDIFYEIEKGIINIYDTQYTRNIDKKILDDIYINKYIQFLNYEKLNKNDIFCILLSYVFDIKHKESFNLLYEKKYINKIFNKINVLKDDKCIYDDINGKINKYIIDNMIDKENV